MIRGLGALFISRVVDDLLGQAWLTPYLIKTHILARRINQVVLNRFYSWRKCNSNVLLIGFPRYNFLKQDQSLEKETAYQPLYPSFFSSYQTKACTETCKINILQLFSFFFLVRVTKLEQSESHYKACSQTWKTYNWYNSKITESRINTSKKRENSEHLFDLRQEWKQWIYSSPTTIQQIPKILNSWVDLVYKMLELNSLNLKLVYYTSPTLRSFNIFP